jgi:hypothetical protein
VENGEIVGDFGPQNDPISLKSLSETSRTYVNIKEHIRKTDLTEGTDCAEARLQRAVTEAEKHLTELEALAVSKDRKLLQGNDRSSRNSSTMPACPKPSTSARQGCFTRLINYDVEQV